MLPPKNYYLYWVRKVPLNYPSQGIPVRLLAGKGEPSFKDKSFEHTSQTGCHFRDSGVENEFYLNMKQMKRVKKKLEDLKSQVKFHFRNSEHKQYRQKL